VVSLTATAASTIWNTNATATTLNAGTSEIVVSNASANARITSTGNKTFYKLTYTIAASSGVLQIPNAAQTPIFNTLNIGPAHNLRLFSGSTVNVLNFVINGTAGNLVTLDSSTAGTAATLSKQYVSPVGNVWSFFGTARVVAGYLALDGVSGTYASTPDSAALSLTGDMDIRADVALDDWTPTADTSLVAKRTSNTGTTTAYQLRISTNGNAQFLWSDGVTTVTEGSGVALGFTDGTRHQIRVTFEVNTGAGQYRVRFFTRDSDTDAWVQVGSDNVGATITPQDNTTALELGADSGGTQRRLAGKIYKAEVRNGIDGTVVANPDFTQSTINQFQYLSVKDSTAIGYGAFWDANGTLVSGNTNWNDGVAIAGSVATELTTAAGGTAAITVSGTQSSETDTENPGALLVVQPGNQTTESTTAFEGSPAVVVYGTQDIEVSTPNIGTPAISLLGNQSEEVSDASSGNPNIAVFGGTANEVSSGFAGAASILLIGGQVAELTTAGVGGVLVVFSGIQANEVSEGFVGSVQSVLSGSSVTEINSAITGRVIEYTALRYRVSGQRPVTDVGGNEPSEEVLGFEPETSVSGSQPSRVASGLEPDITVSGTVNVT
jgi:hypothetical protein